MSSFYQDIVDSRKKRFALLIDPDKHNKASLAHLVSLVNATPPDVLLVGGSLLFNPIEDTIVYLKEHVDIPVFIFMVDHCHRTCQLPHLPARPVLGRLPGSRPRRGAVGC